jgi:hypothetical protein
MLFPENNFFANYIPISIAEYSMSGNATATSLTNAATFYKIAGTTTAGSYISGFSLSNNRATLTSAVLGMFRVSASLTLFDGNNQTLAVRIAKNGTTISTSEIRLDTGGHTGTLNVFCQTVTELLPTEYIEVFIANVNNPTTSVTVTDLNVIVERLS